MLWSGWGAPERTRPLSEPLRSLLEAVLGIQRTDTLPVTLATVRVAPSALAAVARAAIVDAVGEGWVRDDHRTRVLHAGGKSTLDLLRLRGGDAVAAPDAVVLPGTHDEVLAVLAACTVHEIAVVPFGGGTSVVGGVEPIRGRFGALVALDLRRLDGVSAVDTVSMTARLGAGLRAPQAETRLADHGLTLGHSPQSFEHATIGGFAATRSAGQASAGYGRFDEMVEELTVATPVGTLRAGRGPASAAGPDLRHLILGSEGTLGVVTSVTVRVRAVPAVVHDEGWHLPSFAAGLVAVRALAQADAALPAVLRLSDEAETAVGLATAAPGDAPHREGGCLLITGFEGDAGAVARRRAVAAEVLTAQGADSLGEAPGRAWRQGRFAAPFLRDAILDIGGMVDTLETAVSWSAIAGLHQALRRGVEEALRGVGTPGLVLCHVSHVYPSGASLYVTVAAARAPDPVAQWHAVKRAAGDAIGAHGATITHHHGVGVEHLPWMRAEVGELGLAVLGAVRRTLDPAGILNPGKLIPHAPG